MFVVHIASEMAPFIKVGGLADVIHGLSKKWIEKGEKTLVILPKYSFIPPLKSAQEEIFSSFFEGNWVKNKAVSITFEKIPILFIEPLENTLFSGESAYTQNDFAKFLYFCRACLDYLQQKNIPFDILHLHDWHTSFCSFLIKTLFSQNSLAKKKTILTIHNLLYQGIGPISFLKKLGASQKQTQKLASSPLFEKSLINLLQVGIQYADWITAVSPSYAQEIITAKKGCGLHTILRQRKRVLSGIVNGLDEDAWNPEKDLHVPFPFSYKNSPVEIDRQKRKNRSLLEKQLHLPERKGPLVIAVCRLVEQKGPELLAFAARYTLQNGGNFVLLGSHPGEKDTALFAPLIKKPGFHLHLIYDDGLARLSFAAADFIVIPSRFEPCGLTQLIAMRYAAIPIARKTGGLQDTLFDIDDTSISKEKKNGYLFENYEETELEATLKRAFNMWHKNPSQKTFLRKNGMQQKSGWEKSVEEYEKLYQKLLSLPEPSSSDICGSQKDSLP